MYGQLVCCVSGKEIDRKHKSSYENSIMCLAEKKPSHSSVKFLRIFADL